MRAWKYLAGFTIPITVFISLYAGGIWSFTSILYGFMLLPILESLLPDATANLEAAEEEMAKKDRTYDILLYLNVPIQYGLLIFFLWSVKQGGQTTLELIGMTLSMGLSCGVIGINVAHELGHRKPIFEQGLAKALLLTSLYMHFIIEHNRGHHKNVSTDDDPASARRGEGIYAFWFRSVRDSIISAWQLEAKRMRHEHKKVWSAGNQMLQFASLELGLLMAILVIFGWLPLLLFIAAATMGFLLLETINYIEHYGLRRRQKSSGLYERVMPWHSWNSSHIFGRLVLYELTRHSDHHYMASRPYQVLRHMEEAPQLPAGYPAMMLLSLIPALWFRVMDKRVDQVMMAHTVDTQNVEL